MFPAECGNEWAETAPMQQWNPIRYRDFWDVPRIFFTEWHGQSLLFDCTFDEESEDYLSEYRVYLMPALAPEVVAGPWGELHERATAFLGKLPTVQVEFDPTKRTAINAQLLIELLSQVKLGS